MSVSTSDGAAAGGANVAASMNHRNMTDKSMNGTIMMDSDRRHYHHHHFNAPPQQLHHVLLLGEKEEHQQNDFDQGGTEKTDKNVRENKKKRRLLVLDRPLRNDYLAKRYRAYCELHQLWLIREQQLKQPPPSKPPPHEDTSGGTKTKKKKIPNAQTTSRNTCSSTNNELEEWMSDIYKPKPSRSMDDDDDIDENESFWHGATPLERALVACCVPCPVHPNHDTTTTTTTTTTVVGPSHHRGHTRHYGSDTNENKSSSSHNSSGASFAPGVLVREHIPQFVGLMAMHCHTIGSRALALAILQVTLEMDVFDDEDEQDRQKQYEMENEAHDENNGIEQAETFGAQESIKTCEEESSKAKQNNTSNDITIVERMSPKFVRPRRELLPSRIHIFMQAGGLQLMARWLKESRKVQKIDADVPLPNGTKKNTTSNGASPPKSKSKQKQAPSPQTFASPTGKLLLPIVQFLQHIPIGRKTKKLMRQLKLGVDVLDLQTQLKAIAKSQLDVTSELSELLDGEIRGNGPESIFLDDPSVQLRTDPISGGLPVVKVLSEVNKLIEIWKEKSEQIQQNLTNKEVENKCKLVSEPFAEILSEINDRLQVLQHFEGIDSRTAATDNATVAELPTMTTLPDSNHPNWLKDVINQREKKLRKLSSDTKRATANDRKLSLQERERLEHEMERKIMNEKQKAKLEECQKEKAALLRKMQENEASRARSNISGVGTFGSERSTIITKPLHRKLKWKDGLTGISSNVRKELLEQVFVYTPYFEEWATSKKGKCNRSNDRNDAKNEYNEPHDEEDYHMNINDNEERYNGENHCSNEAHYEDRIQYGRETQCHDGSSNNDLNYSDDEENNDDEDWMNESSNEVDDDEVVILENPPH